MKPLTEPLTAHPDAWQHLRQHTAARLALGRAGAAQPTQALLEFGLAHARARDAVHLALDARALSAALAADGWRVLQARSQAPDRATYLLRPDLGRALHPESRHALLAQPPAPQATPGAAALAIVVADGLSALAVQRHAQPLLQALRTVHPAPWAQVPVVVATQGRVALGDGIAQALQATCVLVLVGERPGLSSPDSLGLYLTHAPRPGRLDSERNCISNIRPAGLSYDDAARRAHYLLTESHRLGYSGVQLKDNSAIDVLPGG